MKAKWFNTPNRVTISRILLSLILFVLLSVPLFVAPEKLILIPTTHITVLDLVCFVFFIALGATDGVDGHLARSTNQVTDLGKVLDPLADKMLVDGTMVLLSARSPMLLPPLFTVLFICRDLLVDGVRIMCASKGHVVAANMWGKVKTVMEMVLIPIVIIRGFPFSYLDRYLSPTEFGAWGTEVADQLSYQGELSAMVFCLVLGVATLVLSLVSGGIYIYRGRYALIGDGSDHREDK